MRHPDLAVKENTVLVVIDYQEKLVNMLHNPETAVENTVRMIDFARTFQIPVVLTEHYPKGLGETISQVKEALPSFNPVEKRIFSCFGVPEFEEALLAAGAKNLLVCGIETHVCVSQTVHDALARGYRVHVVREACGTRFESDHLAGLAKMDRSGAILCTTEMVMYEIVERADNEDFKLLLKLVK